MYILIYIVVYGMLVICFVYSLRNLYRLIDETIEEIELIRTTHTHIANWLSISIKLNFAIQREDKFGQ